MPPLCVCRERCEIAGQMTAFPGLLFNFKGNLDIGTVHLLNDGLYENSGNRPFDCRGKKNRRQKKGCERVIGSLYTKYYRSSQSSSYTGLRCAVSVKYTLDLPEDDKKFSIFTPITC